LPLDSRRKFSNEEIIEPHLIYNRWLKRDGQNTLKPMTLVDTSKLTVDESVDEVERWVKRRLT